MQAYMRIGLCGGDACDMFYGTMNSCATGGAFFMSGIEVKYMDAKAITPYARNSRTHSDEQIAQVAASIKEFGWTNPILIDEKHTIIAGHGRLMAAQRLGFDEVPTIMLPNLTDAQKRAYVIADNKLALNAGWDEEMLAVEIEELLDQGYDLDLTGFGADEIDSLLAEAEKVDEGLTDEDAVPEAPAEPISKLGDVWKLGKHRVLCGDSTSIDCIDALMLGSPADMVFTDPPYNADYKSRGGNELLRKGIKNDAMSNQAFDDFISGFLPMMFAASKEGASFYVCCNWKDSYPRFYNHITDSGMNVSSCIVWDKKSGGMGWQDYRYQYELIIYGFKKDKAHSWYGGRTETDIWQFSRENRTDYVHPTQKPVELIERAINNSSKAGDCVVDLFGGSGSTLIACEKTGRHSRLLELDPIYVDVIVKRWQDFTGQDAVHEASGKTFNELSNGKTAQDEQQEIA
jgi:DNA modification methylase